jgi:hypothetical protein
MVPNLYLALDALPRLPNGKLDRLSLPAPDELRDEAGYIAPRNPTEQLLAGVWAEVLSLEKVGIRDNFFEIGGNSLLIVKLHSRLSPHFNGGLLAADLFTYPTIEKLGAYLDKGRPVQQAMQDSDERRENRRNRALSIKQRMATRNTK